MIEGLAIFRFIFFFCFLWYKKALSPRQHHTQVLNSALKNKQLNLDFFLLRGFCGKLKSQSLSLIHQCLRLLSSAREIDFICPPPWGINTQFYKRSIAGSGWELGKGQMRPGEAWRGSGWGWEWQIQLEIHSFIKNNFVYWS